MIKQSVIVAISPNAAYTTAVLEWKWHCDQRTIPEFQTNEGEVVKFVKDGRLFKLSGEIRFKNLSNIYLGKDWQNRSDAGQIKQYIEIMKDNNNE